MKVRLWPYKLESWGAKNLQLALQTEGIDCLRVRTNGRYRPKPNQLIINWGNSIIPEWMGRMPPQNTMMFNVPPHVSIASNKLRTFQALEVARVSIPECIMDKDMAAQAIHQGKKIYCRTKLTGKGGEGIVVASSVEELVEAPLYTVGINTEKEYRVHVFCGRVIDITQKRRRTDADGNIREDINMDIRNLSGGWVFCHGNVNPPESVMEQSLKAIEALGLDFGAVDVVIDREGNACVLEINTAPGISSSQTLAAYVAAIKECLSLIDIYGEVLQ